MSKWPGKYVIGLTGNIATGKSVVRKMLEHLGAYGIDADALSHRAMAKGAPGYRPVVETFGRWVLAPNQEVDRSRLSRIVFSDPLALKELERIIHPLVNQATDLIVQRSTQSVIVIEAIKLLETDLYQSCDNVWVSYAPPNIQLARLVKQRKMAEVEAKQRIIAQPPQEQKISAANVVIKNTGTYENTWRQVQAAWQKIFPGGDIGPVKPEPAAAGELHVLRGRPRHASDIAMLINRLNPGKTTTTPEDIMAAFGEKAFLLLQCNSQLMGLVGWQVENLVARTTDMYIDPSLPVGQTLTTLITEVEKASRDLQCEVSLLFLPPNLAQHETVWKNLGYEQRTSDKLGIQAWQEAATESMTTGSSLFFKQLRVDRILRPI